jgi:hypothetical protein
MIVKQTTTLIFEYPQDYLQEQKWCKVKEGRWIHKSTDTLGAVYENTISYSVGPEDDFIKNLEQMERDRECEQMEREGE